MKKETYPKRIYLSASWKPDDRPSTVRMANLIANQGVTVVRDHEENKNEDPVKAGRTWAGRVQALMADCSGLVVVFTHNGKCNQTTSPFLIPEILTAAEQGIPVLLFAHPSVQIEVTDGVSGVEFRFSKALGNQLIQAKDVFSIGPKEQVRMENLLQNASGFEVPYGSRIKSPLPYPNSTDSRSTEHAVEDFVILCKDRDPYPYVFNVLPFSLQDSVHKIIATEVFRATGMACHISLDSITDEQSVRKNWDRMIRESNLIIAELSSLRDTCIFEAGCAIGLNKPFFIVSKKGQEILPFGLDDQSFIRYNSDQDLAEKISEICGRMFRREVFNLSSDFSQKIPDDGVRQGVPKWFGDKSKFNLESRLTVAIWAIGLSVAFGTQIVFKLFLPESPPPNPLAIFTALTGFLALSRVGREFWEKRIGRHLAWVPWVATLVMVVLAVALLVIIVRAKAPASPVPNKPIPRSVNQ